MRERLSRISQVFPTTTAVVVVTLLPIVLKKRRKKKWTQIFLDYGCFSSSFWWPPGTFTAPARFKSRKTDGKTLQKKPRRGGEKHREKGNSREGEAGGGEMNEDYVTRTLADWREIYGKKNSFFVVPAFAKFSLEEFVGTSPKNTLFCSGCMEKENRGFAGGIGMGWGLRNMCLSSRMSFFPSSRGTADMTDARGPYTRTYVWPCVHFF